MTVSVPTALITLPLLALSGWPIPAFSWFQTWKYMVIRDALVWSDRTLVLRYLAFPSSLILECS